MSRCLSLVALALFATPSVAAEKMNTRFTVSADLWSKEELQRFNTTMRQSLTNEAIRRALITYLAAVKERDDKKDPIASVKQILALQRSFR